MRARSTEVAGGACRRENGQILCAAVPFAFVQSHAQFTRTAPDPSSLIPFPSPGAPLSNGANVKTIDVIRDFRATLISFTEDAKLALMEAHSDVQKTVGWIQYDRMGFWANALKKRHEIVQRCKLELARAQLQSRDERPSCVLERKALVKAQAEFDEAQRKLDACKKGLALLDREGLLFKAALAGFSTNVEIDLPRAIAHLERLMQTLEQYFSVSAPRTDPLKPRAASSDDSTTASGATRPPAGNGSDSAPPAPKAGEP